MSNRASFMVNQGPLLDYKTSLPVSKVVFRTLIFDLNNVPVLKNGSCQINQKGLVGRKLQNTNEWQQSSLLRYKNSLFVKNLSRCLWIRRKFIQNIWLVSQLNAKIRWIVVLRNKFRFQGIKETETEPKRRGFEAVWLLTRIHVWTRVRTSPDKSATLCGRFGDE